MRPQVKETSFQAWQEIKTTTLGEKQRAVYDALKSAKRPVTGREIAQFLNLDGAWKRLPELERRGLVMRSGTRRCSVTGRSAQTWVRVI
jgi:predicted ArsR family transcriptional regulator